MTQASGVDGRLVLVTGASSGIGLAAARQLARQGARLVLACRDPERGELARRAVAAEARHEPRLLLVDVSDQDALHAAAREFRAQHDRLDVLLNNAGIWSSKRRLSRQGIELTWATNVLGYSLLTELLLEPLRAARGRVVCVASRLARGLDLDDVQFERRPYEGLAAYAQSKQANRLWSWGLARRLDGSGVTVHALHPGGVNTGIFGKGGGLKGWLGAAYMRFQGRTPDEGADTAVWLCGALEAGARSGVFWVNRRESACEFRDTATEDRLEEICRRLAPVRAQA